MHIVLILQVLVCTETHVGVHGALAEEIRRHNEVIKLSEFLYHALNGCFAEIFVTACGGKIFSALIKVLPALSTCRGSAYKQGSILVLLDNHFLPGGKKMRVEKIPDFEISIITSQSLRTRLSGKLPFQCSRPQHSTISRP